VFCVLVLVPAVLVLCSLFFAPPLCFSLSGPLRPYSGDAYYRATITHVGSEGRFVALVFEDGDVWPECPVANLRRWEPRGDEAWKFARETTGGGLAF